MPIARGNPRVYVGIDPGAKGGMALISSDRLSADKIPETERDIWDQVRRYVSSIETVAMIEKVGGYVPGSQGNIGSAMFKFGQGYGMLRGFLIASGVRFEEVTPAVWQRAFGIPPKKKTETKTQFKNRLKARAQQLFPQLIVTLSTCDALLIAEYLRRKEEGRL